MKFFADTTKTVLLRDKLPTDRSMDSRTEAVRLSIKDALLTSAVFTALLLCWTYLIERPYEPWVYILGLVFFFVATACMDLWRYLHHSKGNYFPMGR